ncbi:MAG: RluA family pseudouridine synthase [Prosthecobacter sp.]|jgi:23S rRNA pseudouridine1911/1915/1917 synthase|uniref:RluA family pseudouridine synthase n=1 Tax=Prosthecobacter sp. TaxID=1965333 RepID=UPI0019E17B6E|nr:RluA family pseudouridine synthase [Prosthecobacter sp.]MBE2287560.1 RluA family pseudouridine synthase [Prosthecobacter sp.]
MSTPSESTRCEVLHEDRFLLVVNKPHGFLSHPNPQSGKPQSAAFEGRYDADRRCFTSAAGKVWLIHRLDQDTSGVLLAAKDEKTAAACREAFEAEAVRKIYLALCAGGGLKPEGVWLDHLVTAHERHQVRTTVRHGPRPNAEAHYRLREYSPAQRLSLVEIELITGKTHQIRVQAASRRLPLVGDDVYGSFDLNRKLRQSIGARRLFLHAHELRLKHPASGQMLNIKAPLPPDLSGVLAAAGMKAG